MTSSRKVCYKNVEVSAQGGRLRPGCLLSWIPFGKSDTSNNHRRPKAACATALRGHVVAVKVLLIVLMLALAGLAIPTTSAALPIQCTYGPTSPGGDTHCEGSVAKCDVLVHMYDQEDALNRYQVDCSGCGINVGGGGLVDCDLIGPAASPTPLAVAAAADPIKTHCWTAEDGSGCSTTVANTCTYNSGTMGGVPLISASCWTSTTGWCDVTVSPVQTPPVWCDGPRAASADIDPQPVCQDGIAQTWCDVSAGPCDLRVTPWTAWGDQYVVSDCRTGGAGPTCHTEAHTQAPTAPEHWCAF